jgi:hypothetical protein
MKKEYFICIIILLFFVFFIFTEFILYCGCGLNNFKEGFNKDCIGQNITQLTDILLDDLDSITKIKQINRIQFTSSESGNFKPILQATVKSKIPDIIHGKLKDTVSTDLDPDLKIEYLKQKIIKIYILDCKNTDYNSMSKIQDIKYLKSNNVDIQKVLNSKKDPSYKILDIETILDNQNNHYI